MVPQNWPPKGQDPSISMHRCTRNIKSYIPIVQGTACVFDCTLEYSRVDECNDCFTRGIENTIGDKTIESCEGLVTPVWTNCRRIRTKTLQSKKAIDIYQQVSRLSRVRSLFTICPYHTPQPKFPRSFRYFEVRCQLLDGKWKSASGDPIFTYNFRLK